MFLVVAGPGIEPGIQAKETCVIPFYYPAILNKEKKQPKLLLLNFEKGCFSFLWLDHINNITHFF